jgi:hypothetical protein
MQLNEFIQQVRSEPERAVRRAGLQISSETLAKAHQAGGVRLTELLAQGQPSEAHELRYRHILGPPATDEALAAWQRKRPSQMLPADLLALTKSVNGIHLWADPQTGRSYSGLAPIEEWEIARIKMYGAHSSPQLLDDRYVAISYHTDGAMFVVVDTVSGKYYAFETSGPDTNSLIANDVGGLLDWLWRSRRLPGNTSF